MERHAQIQKSNAQLNPDLTRARAFTPHLGNKWKLHPGPKPHPLERLSGNARTLYAQYKPAEVQFRIANASKYRVRADGDGRRAPPARVFISGYFRVMCRKSSRRACHALRKQFETHAHHGPRRNTRTTLISTYCIQRSTGISDDSELCVCTSTGWGVNKAGVRHR